MLTTARLSADRDDFGLIAMPALLEQGILEACGANIAGLGDKTVLLRCRRRSDETR